MSEHNSYNQYDSLGDMLSQKRRLLDLSLEDVQAKTRIRTAFIKALEKGNHYELPADVYVLGYLRSLSKLYGLELTRLTEMYLKEQSLGRKMEQENFKPQPSARSSFTVTPKTIFGLTLAAIFLTAVSYIGWQIVQVTAAPKLVVESPGPEAIIQSNVIDIKGRTEPGSTLTINNQSVPLEKDGTFNQSLYLASGENQIIVRSSNRFNRISEIHRRVVVGGLPQVLGEISDVTATSTATSTLP